MKVALIILAVLAVVVGAIILEARPERPEDLRSPTGPSSVMRGLKQRAAERAAKARQFRAMQIEGALRTDGGADLASF